VLYIPILQQLRPNHVISSKGTAKRTLASRLCGLLRFRHAIPTKYGTVRSVSNAPLTVNTARF